MNRKSFPIFSKEDFGLSGKRVTPTGDGTHAVMNEEAQQKYKHVPLKAVYIDFMAQESVNALDHRPMFGLPTDNKLVRALYDWDFEVLKAQVGKQLSMKGYAFVYMLNDGLANEYAMYFGEAFVIEGRHKFRPDEVIVSNNYYDDTVDGKHQKGAIRFFKRDGKVFFQAGTYGETFAAKPNKDGVNEFEFVGLTEIPGRFIRNNQESVPDWFRVDEMLTVAETYFNDIPGEKEFAKTLLAENANFGEGTNSNSTEATIVNGGRTIQFNEFNSAVGMPTQIFSQGSPSLADAIGTYKFHLDEIFKLSFTNRDMQSSGTNKHNTEVSIFNQTASQYLSTKKRQREMDWSRLFMDIILPLLKITTDDIIKLTFDISDFEKHKIERAAAEIKEINARADSALITAKANDKNADARMKQASQNNNTPKVLDKK